MNETPSIEQLAALINFSADAVVLVDAGGVIRWASPSSPEVLGFSPGDLVGVRVQDLVEPGDHGVWRAVVDRLIEHPGTAQSGTFRCRHQDGSVRWTEGFSIDVTLLRRLRARSKATRAMRAISLVV